MLIFDLNFEPKGLVPAGYTCQQLQIERTLYRDIEDEPIKAAVRYRSGCEIRCVNEDCHGPDVGEKEEQRKMVVGPGARKSVVLNNVEKVLLERSFELQRKMSQNRMNIRHICRLYRATIGETKLCKSVVQFI